MKATKPKTINSYERKLCPEIVYDFTGFTTEPIKEIMKVDMAGKKMGEDVAWFQHANLGEIQEIIDTTLEELTEDYLREMSASELVVPDNEEKHTAAAVPENQWILDGLAEGFDSFMTVFDFFYDMDLSVTLKTKIHNGKRVYILQKYF